jgi:NAD(P)-dependent dehydrogenase (short-subunit alcohol dehydrogenase family)
MNLQNKLIVITGGNRGIGREVAEQVAAVGADVVITYRKNAEEAQAVVKGIEQAGRKAVALQLDVEELASFEQFTAQLKEAMTKTFGRTHFDGLINNAGFGMHELLADATEAAFDQLMNVHFKGVVFLSKHLLPLMADGGRIVNITTGLVRFSFPGYGLYAAMKGALEVITRYQAKELGARQITVNSVAPGALYTDFNKERFDGAPQMVEYLASLSPLNRIGQADDVGGVVAFLLSDDAKWITGQRIEVSGGVFA